MNLPPALLQAIEQLLRGVDRQQLARDAEQISRRYREEHGRSTAQAMRSDAEALAYVVQRLPATFAAASHVFANTIARVPDFAPRSLLDLGSGPGTLAWAASVCWPSLGRATLVERSSAMRQIGQRLAKSGSALLQQATWQASDLSADWPATRADLVSLGSVLGELSETQRATLIAQAWAQTEGVLAVLEPGTPRGFAHILAAREQLLAAGAHLFAPCPHHYTCPLTGSDWCHMRQRLARPPFQRQSKQARLGHEDEKLSYLVVARFAAPLPSARILRHPQRASGRVTLRLCNADGSASDSTIPRSAGETYRRARDADWGDEW